MFFSSTASAGTRYGCWDREFEDLHSCLQYDAEVKASPPGDAVTYIFRIWLDSGWLPRDNHLDFRQVKTTIVRPGDGSFVSFGKATLYRCTFNPGVTPNGSDPAFSTNCPAEPPPADPPKMAGGVNPDLCCGNPVNVGTGNKYQRERDSVGSGPFPLVFERHYNSYRGIESRLIGRQWLHTYDRILLLSGTTVTLQRADGKTLKFVEASNDWIGDPDVPGRLRRLVDGGGQPTGWEYTDEDDSVEVYSNDRRLLTITTRTGFTHSLTYGIGSRLAQVTGPFGRTLTFTYGLDDRLEFGRVHRRELRPHPPCFRQGQSPAQ